jgi:four helix bundle protein
MSEVGGLHGGPTDPWRRSKNKEPEMVIRKVRDLEVYCEGFDLAVEIHRATESFDWRSCGDVKDQIRRSSKSICALIAEGFGRRQSAKEFRRYLRMSHGSLQETKVWIEFCQALDLLPTEKCRDLWQRYDILGKRLYRLSERWERPTGPEQPATF